MTRGKFITLEGMDGAGKSTHLSWIPAFLESRGVRVRLTREPGGTKMGERLRELMLHKHQEEPKLHPDTEALLMFAARREHLDKVIVPALHSGDWVVCDRFTDATFAYQAAGSGLSWDRISTLESWVHGEVQPDLTLYFDVPAEVGIARTHAAREPDRFEQEGRSFFDRVRSGYLRRAREHPARMLIVDGSAALEIVKSNVEELLINNCFK
jgi:dTMP kinase